MEEMYTGYQVVKAFGHEAVSVAEFNGRNDTYCEAGGRAQFATGLIMPLMMFIGIATRDLVDFGAAQQGTPHAAPVGCAPWPPELTRSVDGVRPPVSGVCCAGRHSDSGPRRARE